MTWLRDKLVRNHEIVVRESEDVFRLGPSLTLEDSVVDLRGCTHRDLIMLGGELKRCEIRVPKKCRHINWTSFKMHQCKFLGDIMEHRFGNEVDLPTPSGGELVDCDFSEAMIWDALFLGVDMKRLKMPSWPSITLLRENQTCAKDYGDISWPDDFGELLDDYLECEENTTAMSFDAQSLVPEFVSDMGTLKAFVEKHEFFL